MTSKWPLVRLDQLFGIGSSKRVMKSDWSDSGVPFYRGREISTLATFGNVENDLFISEELYESYSKKYGIPATGDLMMTAIGTVGNVWVVEANHRFYFKDASVLWLAKKQDCSSEFIRYWMKSKSFFDQLKLGTGATVDSLTIGRLCEVEVPLPPLDEQERIVAKLDDAMITLDRCSSRIDSQIKQAQLLENAYKTHLFQAIHLAEKNTTLGQVAEKVVVGFVGTCAPFYTPDGVPFLRTQNVTKSGLDISQFQRISREFHHSNKKSQLLEGDVLLSRVITNDVNVGIVPRDLGEANCANVVIVRPGKKLLPEFVAAYISTKTAQKYLLDRKVGSAQVVVNTSVVKDWPIIAPSVKEQKEIMDKLDLFLDVHQRRVAKLDEISRLLNTLRSSILSAAFAGDF